MARDPSPRRALDLAVERELVRAWKRAGLTYDRMVAASGIGRNRLQSIKAHEGTAVSVGEAYAIAGALGLNGDDVIAAAERSLAEDAPLAALVDLHDRRAAKVAQSDPPGIVLPIASMDRNIQEEFEGR